MPRPLVFANGSLLVQIDEHYDIRDLCYPLPGQWNHLAGAPIRMGVYCNGHFTWCADASWQKDFEYIAGGLVAESLLTHEAMGLELCIREATHHDQPWHLREIEVHHTRAGLADVRVYFAHDLRLEESDMGDTAMVIPHEHALVHFKRSSYVLFGVDTLFEYATGVRGDGRGDGCWRDAEDGHLSNRAIDQGSVDSVFSVRLDLGPGEKLSFGYWIAMGEDLDGVLVDSAQIRDRGVATLLDETQQHWGAWHAARPVISELSESIKSLYATSLSVVASQCGSNGAILAANDSSIMVTNRANYSYVWPRDGALVAMAMDDAGYREFAERYFEFCYDLVSEKQPFYLQKYCPDGTVGATWHPRIIDGKPEVPMQEDETALTALAFCRHHRENPSRCDFELYQRLVVWACDFMAAFVDERGLPKPSYDLWEERRGVHAYTAITVIAALEEASRFADARGEADAGNRWRDAANRMRAACDAHMTDGATGRWIRCLGAAPDMTVDSATLNSVWFGVDDPYSTRAWATLKAVRDKLLMRSGITGVARYEADYYCRQVEDQPGNPWIICTMWLAQVLLLRAKTKDDLAEPTGWLQWVCDRATNSGILAEQYHPHTGAPLSVSPLTWSHAEFIRTVCLYHAISQKLG